jgi:hypothetical protein
MKRFLSSCARLPRVLSIVGVAASPSLAAAKRPSFAILLVPKYLAVVLAAGLASFAGTAEAAIVSLGAPFTVGQNFGRKYLNFDGTSLTGSDSRGSNSATFMDVYSNFYFTDTTTSSNYAYNAGTNAPLRFNYGDVVSAATTDFTYANNSTVPSDSGLTYFVVGFYNNADVTSFPNTSPNNAFIAGSNLAWLAVSRTVGGGDITVEAAGVNTVAGGSIAVGEYVAPVPEPSTYAMALAGLACGGYSMFRRRRAR